MPKSSINLKLKQNSNLPYWSDGNFSMHELLEDLLKQTGPAAVHISSFSLSEVAVRKFLDLKEQGLLTSLNCLLDLTVKRHRLGLLFFASNIVSEISLTNCHAKLILIENDKWKVAVIGSANFNVNPKKEIGIVSTVNSIYSKFIEKYNEWYTDGLIVKSDEF